MNDRNFVDFRNNIFHKGITREIYAYAFLLNEKNASRSENRIYA